MCGAFFAFGYMIGRNATRTAVTASTAAATPDGSTPPAAVQSAEPPAETAPADSAPVASDAQPTVTETRPAQDAPVAAAKPAPAVATAVAPAPAPPPPAAPVTGGNEIYLQVTALRLADADNLVKTLKEQNLPALTAGSSKPDLFRVMVGPYHEMTQVAEAKARLKALGFANAFVQR
jgi:cell division septation protein DedD